MKTITTIFIAFFALSSLSVSAIELSGFVDKTTDAHSGGTDKDGCHAGSKPYHCQKVSLASTEQDN